jgi:hypothetical protein
MELPPENAGGRRTRISREPNVIGPVGRNVATNIRRIREVRRLSQRDVAAGMSAVGRSVYFNTIAKIEACSRRVDADDLVALAAALSVSPEQLLADPTPCSTCAGVPPAGFTCRECGFEG